MFDREVVDEDVDVVRGDSWTYELTCQLQDLGCETPSLTHSLDDVRGLDVGLVPLAHLTGVCIRGFGDVLWDRSHGRDDAGGDPSFDRAMTALVLTPGSTPASIVQLRRVFRRADSTCART